MNYLSIFEGCTLLRESFSHLGGVYSPSRELFSQLRTCVPSPRELFSHLGGLYSPSVNYLATWEGVYSPSVNYLPTWEGCTIPP